MQEEWYKSESVSDDEKLEERVRELEDEEEALKKLPTHGVHWGAVEMAGDMRTRHSSLLKFFEEADEVLALNDTHFRRLEFLERHYLDGTITEEEIIELEEDFFKPYLRTLMMREKK